MIAGMVTIIIIAIGAFLLVLLLITLMLLVLWYKLHVSKEDTYNVAGGSVVGGVMINQTQFFVAMLKVSTRYKLGLV